MRDKFFLFLEEVSQKIQEFVDQDKRFLIVSTPTVDGIAASTLLLHYFYLNNVQAHLIYLFEINSRTIQEIYSKYPENVYFFIDTGTLYLDWIKAFAGKPTFILDHLFLPNKEKIIKNFIYHVNPWIFGIDGFREISTSGITYFLLKKLEHEFEDISYLSLAGAIGDLQEEFTGLNEQILNELIESGCIETKKGLKLFGLASKPLYKAIQLSMDIYIPGVTGDEDRAIDFLNKLKIPLKKRGSFTTYLDLGEDEQRKLVSEVIKTRLKENVPNAEKVLGTLYIIPNSFYFKELHEVSSLLEATTRFNKTSSAISYLLGDKKSLDDVHDVSIEFKTELQNAIKEIMSSSVENSNGVNIYDITNLTDKPSIVSSIANFLVQNIEGKNGVLIVKYSSEEKTFLSIRSTPHKNISRVLKSVVDKANVSLLGTDSLFGVIVENEKLENFYKYLKIYARQESILI